MTTEDLRYYVDASTQLMIDSEEQIIDARPQLVPANLPSVIQSALLAECHGQHIGVRACVAEGVISPGMAITRALLENAVILQYMSRDPGNARALAIRWYVDKTRRQRRLVEESARIHKSDASASLEQLDSEIARVSAEAREEFGKDKLPVLPSLPDMAASFRMKKVTKHGGGVLSQYVHSGIDSVAGRIIASPGHAGALTLRDHSPVRIVRCAALANCAMFDAAIATARLQEWPMLDELDASANNRGDAFNALREEVESLEGNL